jgi:sugar lactone lactonase YvrE
MRQSDAILLLLLTAMAAALFALPAQAYVPRYTPSEIAVDASGNVYTIMSGECVVGEGIFLYAANGTELKSYLRPRISDVAIDSRGQVYIVYLQQKRVERLEKNGSFSVIWREDNPDHFINYFAIDRDDNILLSDFNYSNAEMKITEGWILKISPEGQVTDIIESDPALALDKIFQLSASDNGTIYLTDLGRSFSAIYPDGSRSTITHTNPDNGTFYPVGTVVAGEDGYIYVGEMSEGRIQKLTADGTVVTRWEGCGPDRFITPAGIAVDHNGRVYVSDIQAGRVVWFDSNRYRFGEDMAENVAGKGVLWDNVIAGASYNKTNQSVDPGAGSLIGPVLDVFIILAGLGLAGAYLYLSRVRKG